jgi:peptidoglycan L-alanyl-D-glutamate endopeptidase CwlK
MFVFGERSIGIRNQLHPVLQEILDFAIKTSPYDFGLHDGHRSVERQYEYYQQGRTTPGNIVTWIDGVTKRGYHNYLPALAFDFHISSKGNTWDVERKEVDGDPAYMIEVAQHILKVARDEFGIDLVWGGDWRTPDYPHIQLPQSYKKFAESEGLF